MTQHRSRPAHTLSIEHFQSRVTDYPVCECRRRRADECLQGAVRTGSFGVLEIAICRGSFRVELFLHTFQAEEMAHYVEFAEP